MKNIKDLDMQAKIFFDDEDESKFLHYDEDKSKFLHFRDDSYDEWSDF